MIRAVSTNMDEIYSWFACVTLIFFGLNIMRVVNVGYQMFALLAE
ncbi:unnamed protein product, partial [Rotaria magnacalcarata]